MVERAVPGSLEWDDLHADHLARYFYATRFVEGKRVLDAGTGPGYGAAILKSAGAKHVQAVDIDRGTIDRAREDYPLAHLEFIVDDCEELSKVQGPVDVVCSFENIEHLRNPDEFLKASARLLSPAGVLLCSSPDREATDGDWVDGKPSNPFHVMEWHHDEFYKMLSPYFGEVEVLSQVVSLSYVLRKQAVHNLTEHLSYLWSNPFRRFARAMGKVLGRTRRWPSIGELGVPAVEDYAIVPAAVALAVGQPWCHYAICQRPRK